MNCQEVLESITAAVDGALSSEIVPIFQDHITQCSQCRAEYELEQITKAFVRNRVRSALAPAELKQRISSAIAQKSISQPFSGFRPQTPFFARQRWRIALALGSMVIIAFVLLILTPSRSHHPHTSPNDGNIIHQTYNNYDGVLDGKIVPQVASSDPAKVQAFIQPAVNFHVSVPKMKRYTLVGGNSSQYQSHPLVHLVYQHGKDVVYLYQARFKDVLEGTSLNLPANVIDELKRTGWYFENQTPDCSLIIWVADSLICCVVADITKDQLLASLQESE